MQNIDNFLANVGIIKKLNEAVKTDLCFSVFGAGVGEKALSVYQLSKTNKIAYVASDQIELLELGQCFADLGAKFEVANFDLNPPLFTQVVDNLQKNELNKALYNFCFSDVNILLLNPESLLFKFRQKLDKNNFLNLQKNSKINYEYLINKLINLGYKKCQKIEQVGDFSVRGDILDIFLNNYENPIRIELFDDEIEKIYIFSYTEMQKINEIDGFTIFPNKLCFFNEIIKEKIISSLKTSLLGLGSAGDAIIKSHSLVNNVCELLQNNIIDSDCDCLMPFLNKEYAITQILDIAKFVISEPKKTYDYLCDVSKSLLASIGDFIDSGELLPEHAGYYFLPQQAVCFKPNLVFCNVEQKVFESDVTDYMRTVGSRNYVYDYKSLANDLFIYEQSKYKVVLFAGSEESKQTVADFLVKYNLFSSDELNLRTNKFQIVITAQKFAKSGSFLDSGIIFIGTDDLIKRTKNQVKNITKSAKKHKVFYLPKVGDYVVHEIHGIGKCVALQKLNFNGTEKDYFVLEYSGGDKLYLPNEQADSISAYIGGENSPRLHKLGGEQFAKIKQKVKESVSKLAVDLIDLYAKREKSKGFVYSQDNYLFNEFENAFKHTETNDQLLAINDIKNDMHSTKIMDRLICGDVGYGKTEVALRAIYKAVLDGKQVVFLCPTTILAQQHYQTAKERFDGFMVNVAVLNRFKTKSQQEQILKELKDGKVDVLIGTHRLLSKDVVFKDLGLLVLDEEQRFGVSDKEKIKDLKKNIDVLTLSATPIPRTLNMALTGIRDISIIETPPRERIAVKTFVSEESDTLILNACKRELARGGQVLFVYNRVEHIFEQAERLKTLLPNARIGVAHGQMPEKLLEQTIMNLYNKEYDILVATTLIESGIDLPLANTLIVIDADRLGLGELYQLRGRIGRSDRVAYAYFTYNPSKMLTPDAYKRLDAILEYTELGSGFKIAMRDLEIRGAGNILGKEQHGHLEKVGYDMYCKLLESAVKELKGEKVKDIKPIKIDIAISAILPESFVQAEEERIKLYSDISQIQCDDDMQNMKNKLFDSYGQVPAETENLLKIAYLKNLCVKLGVKRVVINANVCKIYLYKSKEIMQEGVSRELSQSKCGVLSFEEDPVLTFDLGLATVLQKLNYILDFCRRAV
ncbi:MAG: transcription-repair coupling factor [Clostridia bacterium]|nr:transcription-repair coupling factor [Clostridia bacterium]